ncbi:MAG: hypothetical protein AAF514_14120, partial [Verrucomicrobiota bacterium]
LVSKVMEKRLLSNNLRTRLESVVAEQGTPGTRLTQLARGLENEDRPVLILHLEAPSTPPAELADQLAAAAANATARPVTVELRTRIVQSASSDGKPPAPRAPFDPAPVPMGDAP